MSTLVEQRTQPMGAYDMSDHLRLQGPQFTNPWGAQAGASAAGQHYYAQSQQQQQQPPSQQPAPAQSQQSAPAHSPIDGFAHHRQYSSAQNPTGKLPMRSSLTVERYAEYSAPMATQSYTATEHNPYAQYESRYPVQYHAPAAAPAGAAPQQRYRSSITGDVLDASQGMVAMSQQDFTPRAQYAPRNGSHDSYGFPAQAPPSHSEHGSISSGSSSYPYYSSYSASVDGSVASSSTDYSSASDDVAGATHRTLPPPSQLAGAGAFPPDATQMMTQFNSKLAATTQKKHKCKICDKRFTRPSSLQTHIYSHTGEKPFKCDFAGCGRHFSVVSNLRRHKKCHRGDGKDSVSPSA